MVNMLLEREDASPNQAAMNGHEGVVKMLLDRVDVNAGSVCKRPVRSGLGSGAAGLQILSASFRVIRCDYDKINR